MDEEKLKSVLESLLFVSGEPIKISKLAKITKKEVAEVENALMELERECLRNNRGVSVIKKDGKVQLVTNPDNAPFVNGLVESELKGDLSKASLEVLSVIAYKEPIARSGIEAIRGVNSSFTLRNLLMRGLIEKVENAENKRKHLYKVSLDFLKKLGLKRVEELPDYEKISKDERIDSVQKISF
jgi:segregation and condensation protein B